MKTHILLFVTLSLVVVPTASASPLFSIGNKGEIPWGEAIDGGLIRPLGPSDQLTSSELQVLENIIANDPETSGSAPSTFSQTRLVPDVQIDDLPPRGTGNQVVDNALFMEWSLEGLPTDALGVGGFEYIYPVDPDLSKLKIDFSIFPPVNMRGVGFSLVDNLARTRTYSTASIPANTWTNGWIRPSVAMGQDGLMNFADTPGFDVTSVVSIRWFEAANGLSGTIPLPPGVGSSPFSASAWNAWGTIAVTPEPTTAATLTVLGFFGLAFRQRRR